MERERSISRWHCDRTVPKGPLDTHVDPCNSGAATCTLHLIVKTAMEFRIIQLAYPSILPLGEKRKLECEMLSAENLVQSTR